MDIKRDTKYRKGVNKKQKEDKSLNTKIDSKSRKGVNKKQQEDKPLNQFYKKRSGI